MFNVQKKSKWQTNLLKMQNPVNVFPSTPYLQVVKHEVSQPLVQLLNLNTRHTYELAVHFLRRDYETNTHWKTIR